MTVYARRVRTLALRLVAFADHARWVILGGVLATVGLLDALVGIPAGVGIGLAAVSAALFVVEIRAHAHRLGRTQFVERTGDSFADVRAALPAERFTFLDVEHGHAVIDRVAGAAVAAGQVVARAGATGYLLPNELRQDGTAFRRRRIARKDTYNGRLLGLRTDVGRGPVLEQTDWEFVDARYWDHLASDIFAMNDVLVGGHLRPGLGRSLFVDRRHRLRDHGESWLLNGVGTSVLAVTTDWRLVLVSQSDRNESSRGMLAPSGSGSLEPADFAGATSLDLRELALNGALRELREETGLGRGDVAATAFLGYGRWLEKAAKPELLSLAVLSIDSHEVRRRRIPSADRPYTVAVDAAPLTPLASWDLSDLPATLVVDGPHRLSVPLLMGLHLLVTSHETSEAGRLLRAIAR